MGRDELKELSIAELQQHFTPADIQAIDHYQTMAVDDRNLDPLQRIVEERLFPKEIIKTYGKEKLLGTLACNVAMFDDETEAAIDRDYLVQQIQKQRDADPLHPDLYTRAYRVRRSVVAFLSDLEAEETPPSIVAENHQPKPSSAA